ncbi:MAG: LapA family protein [Actinobacteria bacterium]|nr:LapA family protein [Actinomycetota bacterium]
MSSGHDSGGAVERSKRENARRLAVAILAAAALLFALFNLDTVKVDLVVFGTVTMPLVVVIAACLLIGGLIGSYLGRRARRRH